MNNPELIYVVWKDAQNSNATHAISSLGDLAELHEVGFLIKETDETLVVGTESADGATEVRFWLTIPKNSIVEQRRVSLNKAFPKPRVPRKKKETTPIVQS